MRVGIITFHETTNFGSTLQAYALYYAIKKLGHECELIDYKCKALANKELPAPFSFSMTLKEMAKHVLFSRDIQSKYDALMAFLNEKAKLSRPYDRNTVYKSANNYDRIIVGSDIVWGMDITKGDTTYFLDFVSENNKKYAFASSIGNPWSKEEKVLVKPMLEEFSGIAVREEESADWIEDLTGIRPHVVCDPTMLLTSEEWLSYKSDKYKDKNYVLAYFDNDSRDCIHAVNKIAKSYGCEALFINYGRPFKGVKSIRPYSIADFLSLIYYAKKVVTASYHGMLFSIYFNKQFVYFNRAHKSRMNTLAKKLGVAMCAGEGKDVLQMTEIDYSSINLKVKEFRNDSLEVLHNFVNNE